MTFAIDEFIDDCQRAIAEDKPALAVRDVVKRALDKPLAVAETFGATEGGLEFLHVAGDLTVLHATWAPGMRLYPHNHNMWAVIGIYGGEEDNEFFRRDGKTLVESGGKALREQDVIVLGDDVIHAVSNPLQKLTGAIHVYGGDFVNTARSQWPRETLEEEPWKMDQVRQEFAKANEAWHRKGS